jgi:hypothetical protein
MKSGHCPIQIRPPGSNPASTTAADAICTGAAAAACATLLADSTRHQPMLMLGVLYPELLDGRLDGGFGIGRLDCAEVSRGC